MISDKHVKLIDLGTISVIKKRFNESCSLSDRSTSEIGINLEDSLARKKGYRDKTEHMGIKRISHQKCGTVLYSPPELMARLPHITDKIDVWSLSCMIYKMVTGKDLFYSQNKYETETAILRREINFTNEKFSSELKELLTGMIERDLKKRYCIRNVINSK